MNTPDQYWEYKMHKNMTLPWRKLSLMQQHKNKHVSYSPKWQMPSSRFKAFISLLTYVGFVGDSVWQSSDFLGLGVLLKEYFSVSF